MLKTHQSNDKQMAMFDTRLQQLIDQLSIVCPSQRTASLAYVEWEKSAHSHLSEQMLHDMNGRCDYLRNRIIYIKDNIFNSSVINASNFDDISYLIDNNANTLSEMAHRDADTLVENLASLLHLDGSSDTVTVIKNEKPAEVQVDNLPPQVCFEAVGKVFETYLSFKVRENGETRNKLLPTASQLKYIKDSIDLSSPANIALLRMALENLNAVKANVNNRDFVRAMAGMLLIKIKDESDIARIANGVDKKLIASLKPDAKTRDQIENIMNKLKTQH